MNEYKEVETLIQVPATPSIRAWLEARAQENGRALGREAVAIIKAAMAAETGAAQ